MTTQRSAIRKFYSPEDTTTQARQEAALRAFCERTGRDRETMTKVEFAIGYIRKSGKTGEYASSLERQEDDVVDYADRRGVVLLEIRSEIQSAHGEKERPVWVTILADMKRGLDGARHLIVPRLDRASRRGAAGYGELVTNVQAVGAILHSVKEQFDLGSVSGDIIAFILLRIAQNESDLIRERTKGGIMTMVKKGQKHASRQYGYQTSDAGRIVVQVPEEVKIIREIGDRIKKGNSLRSIAADLNARGIETARAWKKDDDGILQPTGTKWTAATLAGLMRSPALRGVRIHQPTADEGAPANPVTEHPGNWVGAAIYTPEEQTEILAALRRGPKAKTTQSLLGGMGVLRCSCGGRMRATVPSRTNGTGNKSPRYGCPAAPDGCGRVSIARDAADSKVKETLIKALDNYSVIPTQPVVDDGLAQKLADAEESRRALVRLKTTIRPGKMPMDEETFWEQHDEFTRQIEETTAAITARDKAATAQQISDLPKPGEAQKWWDDSDQEERRRVIKMVFGVVTVRGAKGIGPKADPSRVRCEPSLAWASRVTGEAEVSDDETQRIADEIQAMLLMDKLVAANPVAARDRRFQQEVKRRADTAR